jgi:AcrR family transcriptional regulator
MKEASCTVALGRPREFDTEVALAAALKVFWRKGFDGASMSDLTEAMGITKPSLYCAFGNKEQLFKKALDLYEREKLQFIDLALAAPTAYSVAERLLTGCCDCYVDPETPGCMGVNSVLANGGMASDAVRDEILRRKFGTETKLRERFERAKAEGDLSVDCDPEALTLFVLTLANGIAVQASTGASRTALNQVVKAALAGWPCRDHGVAEAPQGREAITA